MTFNKGYTLAEILVSIVLIGLLATFIFPAFNNIFGTIFTAGDKTTATYSSQKKIINNIQDRNEDGNTDNNLVLTLNDDGDSVVIDSIPAEIRKGETKYNNPLNQNSENEVTINYYIYYTPTP